MGIDGGDFVDKKPHLVLGVMWQVARLIAVGNVTLQECPEIMRLATENEELSDLLKLKPEEVLVRWCNFHLKEAGQERRIANLGKDLMDQEVMTHVLNQLFKCGTDALNEQDTLKRAEQVIINSAAGGVPDVCSARDLVRGNAKVNTIFVGECFNTKHGLEELTKEEYDAAQNLYEDIEGSKEERSFRLWINSLDIEGLFVDNLYEEIRDG